MPYWCNACKIDLEEKFCTECNMAGNVVKLSERELEAKIKAKLRQLSQDPHFDAQFDEVTSTLFDSPPSIVAGGAGGFLWRIIFGIIALILKRENRKNKLGIKQK